jgi:hypothetical protein
MDNPPRFCREKGNLSHEEAGLQGGCAPCFGLVGQESPVVAEHASCGDARMAWDGNINHQILAVKRWN